jgi:hypothetical protein
MVASSVAYARSLVTEESALIRQIAAFIGCGEEIVKQRLQQSRCRLAVIRRRTVPPSAGAM